MGPVVFIYQGHNYIAWNGRWKQASTADLFSLGVIGMPSIPTYTVASATDWTNLQHSLGPPGPL